MGIDLNLQALPDDCSALIRAKVDSDYWEDFTLVIPAWDYTDKEPFTTYREEHEETKLLFEEFPEISEYAFSLGRIYEGLDYILKTKSYSSSIEATFTSRVIYGNEEMPVHATGGQGILSRYSSPEFVKEASNYLQGLVNSDLAASFNAEEMVRLVLYRRYVRKLFKPY